MDALVESGAQQPVGGDNVDGFKLRKAREQIEVRQIQTLRIRDPVAHRHHNLTNGSPGLVRQQVLTKAVLIARVRMHQTPFVLAEGRRQQSRLAEHALGPTVVLRVPRQHVLEEFLETSHRTALPPQLIVEAQDFGDQPFPHRRPAG